VLVEEEERNNMKLFSVASLHLSEKVRRGGYTIRRDDFNPTSGAIFYPR